MTAAVNFFQTAGQQTADVIFHQHMNAVVIFTDVVGQIRNHIIMRHVAFV